MSLILYPNRMKQLIDFVGIQNKKITPTDIDAVIEIDNKYLLLFEVKKKGVDFNVGQGLLLKRVIDSWQKNNKKGFVIFCTHNTPYQEKIKLKDCTIEGIYINGKMYDTKKDKYRYLRTTVSEYLFEYIVRHNIKKLLP